MMAMHRTASTGMVWDGTRTAAQHRTALNGKELGGRRDMTGDKEIQHRQRNNLHSRDQGGHRRKMHGSLYLVQLIEWHRDEVIPRMDDVIQLVMSTANARYPQSHCMYGT